MANPLQTISGEIQGAVTNPLRAATTDPIAAALAGASSGVSTEPGLDFLGQTAAVRDPNILTKIGDFVGGIKPALVGKGEAYKSARALERETTLKGLNDARKKALAEDALSVGNLLKKGDVDGATNILSERIQRINELKGDPEDTQEILDMVQSGNVSGAVADLDLVVSRAREVGVLEKGGKPISAGNVSSQGEVIVDRGDGTFEAIKVKNFDMDSAPGGYQFGAQVTVKDSNGNLFLATQQKNPSSGSVETVLSSMTGDVKKPVGSVEMVGTYGLTASESLAQITAEESARKRAAAGEKELANIKTSGLKARQMLPQTNRLIELNGLISTGKTAKAKMLMADIFNLESADAANLGEFNSLSGNLVLGMIRQLGANPTEGERAFLLDLNAGIGKGNVINEAILNNLLLIQNRQVARAQMLARNPNMTLDDVLLLEESDFNPSGPALKFNPTTGKIE